MESLALYKKNRSPIKRVGCLARCYHAMTICGFNIILFGMIIYSFGIFPLIAIRDITLNRNFYKSLKSDICNMSNVTTANQLPNISTIGWMPCNCNNEPSYMYCTKLYTNESSTSLVRPFYEHVKYYPRVHIPSKYDKCTFMGNCACTDYDFNNQLNESIKLYNKYNNKLTQCYHDNNYKNIYLELGDFKIDLLIGIIVIILLFVALIVFFYLTAYIGYIMSYVFGCREFLDSYDRKAYDNNTYLFSDSITIANPVYTTENLPEWPNANRDNQDYYYTRTRIQTDSYEV